MRAHVPVCCVYPVGKSLFRTSRHRGLRLRREVVPESLSGRFTVLTLGDVGRPRPTTSENVRRQDDHE